MGRARSRVACLERAAVLGEGKEWTTDLDGRGAESRENRSDPAAGLGNGMSLFHFV